MGSCSVFRIAYLKIKNAPFSSCARIHDNSACAVCREVHKSVKVNLCKNSARILRALDCHTSQSYCKSFVLYVHTVKNRIVCTDRANVYRHGSWLRTLCRHFAPCVLVYMVVRCNVVTAQLGQSVCCRIIIPSVAHECFCVRTVFRIRVKVSTASSVCLSFELLAHLERDYIVTVKKCNRIGARIVYYNFNLACRRVIDKSGICIL